MSGLTMAWAKIAAEPHAQPGWHARRLHPEASLEIRAAIRAPDDLQAVLFEVSSRSLPGGIELPDCVGFHMEVETLEPGPGGRCRLCLVLKDRLYAQVFEALAGDVVTAILLDTTEKQAVRTLLGRLNTWERFMTRFGVKLLSREEQAGLFTELRFLERELLPVMTATDAVRAWRGPTGAPQDFQFANMAVEIKSTTSRNPVSFRVASLEQLDHGPFAHLLLHHTTLWLDENEGLALPDLVSRIRTGLAEDDPGAVSRA